MPSDFCEASLGKTIYECNTKGILPLYGQCERFLAALALIWARVNSGGSE
jgi:hypothetical protein